MVKCIFHEAPAGAQLQAQTLEHKSNSPVQYQQYVVRGLPKLQGSGRDRLQCFPTGEPSSRKGLKASSQVSHRMNGWRAKWFCVGVRAPDPFSGRLLSVPTHRAAPLWPSLLETACSGYLREKASQIQKPRKGMPLSSLYDSFLNLKVKE